MLSFSFVQSMLLCISLLVGFAPGVNAGPVDDLDRILERVTGYTFGEDRRPLNELGEYVRAALGNPAKRASAAKRLAPLLADEKTTAAAKRFIGRQLAFVAGDAEIPILVARLDDEVTGHLARAALENIASPAADTALRTALANHEGAVRIGIINSIGDRRDARATEALAELLTDPDLHAARAAAEALAKIGDLGAAKVLEAAFDRAEPGLREAIAWARFECADRCAKAGQAAVARDTYQRLYAPGLPIAVCRASFRRLVAMDRDGLRMVLDTLKTGHPAMAAAAAEAAATGFPGDAATDALVAVAPALSAARRALLVRALGKRGDQRARPVAVAAAESEDGVLQAAGFEALGPLGTAADAPLLIARLGEKTALAKIARRSLDQLRDEAADRAVAEAVKTTTGAQRVAVIECAAARRCESATGALFDAILDESGKCRKAAFSALGTLARPDELPRFVEAASKVPSGDRKNATRALAEACRRIDDEGRRAQPVLDRLKDSDAPTKCALLPALPRIGGEAALATVRQSLGDSSAEVREAAIRAIADWRDDTPMEEVLRLAKAEKEEKYHVLALRGYQRMVGLEKRPIDEAVASYQAGLAASRRVEEKKLMISGFSRLDQIAAIKAAWALTDEADLRAEVDAAVVKICERMNSTRERPPAPEAVKILKALAAGLEEGKLLDRANKTIDRLEKRIAVEVEQ